MAKRYKIKTILISGLALLFWAFFELSKHHPALAPVNPFAEDPFDAIGSFGVQVAAFLVILCWIRLYLAYSNGVSFPEQHDLLVRTQMLVMLAAGVTLAGDGVAMARHPSQWVGQSAGLALAGLLAGLLLLTLVAGALVYRSVEPPGRRGSPGTWQKALVVSVGAAEVLASYPDSWRQSVAGALFTVLVGAVLLFVQMRVWATALVPFQAEARQRPATTLFAWLKQHRVQVAVVVVGIVLGLALVAAEAVEGGPAPGLARLAMVAAVYVGLETAGLLMGYVALREPLGLP